VLLAAFSGGVDHRQPALVLGVIVVRPGDVEALQGATG